MRVDWLEGLKKFEGDFRLKLEIEDLVRNWREMYPRLDIRRQLVSAHAWVLSNPKRAPKYQKARFLNAWMNRGFQFESKYPKSKPVQHLPPPPDMTQDDFAAMHKQTVKALGPAMCKEEHCGVCEK